MSPADLIDLIINRAPRLRSAGVTSVSLSANGEFSATFDPEQAPAPLGLPDEMPTHLDHPNPLMDEATFGGRIPGRRGPARKE